ncbi:hypothetical protein M2271_007245 [Streptomyces sp. LBL]|nr:hypothetical protein [Streptomyces sp. LBL]
MALDAAHDPFLDALEQAATSAGRAQEERIQHDHAG